MENTDKTPTFRNLYGDSVAYGRLVLPVVAGASALPGALYEARALAWQAHAVADGPWAAPQPPFGDDRDAAIAGDDALGAYRAVRERLGRQRPPHELLTAIAAASGGVSVAVEAAGRVEGDAVVADHAVRYVMKGIFLGTRIPGEPSEQFYISVPASGGAMDGMRVQDGEIALDPSGPQPLQLAAALVELAGGDGAAYLHVATARGVHRARVVADDAARAAAVSLQLGMRLFDEIKSSRDDIKYCHGNALSDDEVDAGVDLLRWMARRGVNPLHLLDWIPEIKSDGRIASSLERLRADGERRPFCAAERTRWAAMAARAWPPHTGGGR